MSGKIENNAVFAQMRGIQIRCKVCGKIEHLPNGWPEMASWAYVCDGCKPAALAELERARREAALAETRAAFAATARDFGEFERPVIREKIANPGAFDAVTRWLPSSDQKTEKIGLICVGNSGAGKTRAAWELYRALSCQHGIACEWTTSAQLSDDAVNAARDGWTGRLIRPLANAPILFVDDLGKGRQSPAAGEFLQDLIARRCNSRRPVVITTQYTGEELARIYGDKNPELFAAFVRRIRQFCEKISFPKTDE